MDDFSVRTDCFPYDLNFKFDAGTSRGVLKKKTSYLIRVKSDEFPGLYGYGEAGPLPKLSIEDGEDLEAVIAKYGEDLAGTKLPLEETALLEKLQVMISDAHPSVRFAFETALLDLMNGGKRQVFREMPLEKLGRQKINGLIWMGEPDFMLRQIEQKLNEGYDCIKMKIGAIDFEQECRLLAHIRSHYSATEVSLRVDANGAFAPGEALEKLDKLAKYDVHSIEQPIRQGHWKEMAEICARSPVPVALDEELIGVYGEKRMELLETVRPPFIILKPTLVGGIHNTKEWIEMAGKLGIGWWMTSALESNIGLNAIFQFTALYMPDMPQGLGTGQLYTNNINSPLTISQGNLYYDQQEEWEDLEKIFK
jgi:o-succinylbenzoate synthase